MQPLGPPASHRRRPFTSGPRFIPLRLVNICRSEEALATTVRKDSVCRRFAATVGGDVSPQQVDDLYLFASRLGYSDALGDLEEFRTMYMKDGRRELETGFIAKVGSLPLGFPRLAGALIKCQLTCPESYLVRSICKFVGCPEVEQLREGKTHHGKASQPYPIALYRGATSTCFSAEVETAHPAAAATGDSLGAAAGWG